VERQYLIEYLHLMKEEGVNKILGTDYQFEKIFTKKL